ncbi:CCA tRNA nucleotidyltransferase [Candidatus Dojkabacteria bacterium]|nr:CCA tRNA nucleotidyltransferase [Candidatus Dojkabacteria bacterium]
MKTETIEIKIPDYVKSVARVLVKEGYQVFLVGGAIRDVLLGKIPKDYDIATDALPPEVLGSFAKAVSTGVKFGTITVLSRDQKEEHHPVEVTTFRSEQQYTDGRWPTKVEFETNIRKDLERRDFTINAFAIDLAQKGSIGIDNFDDNDNWNLIDLFGGLEDIKNKIIRAVGDPVDRFTEDGLRTYKACRLASNLEFTIEPETKAAIAKALTVAKLISMERIRDEFVKLLMNSPKPSVGIELMRETGLLAVFMPEILESVGVEQPEFHSFNVYEHLLRTVDLAPDGVKLAALFHDIGKPRKAMPNGHFYGHDTEGAKITSTIMRRMKFSNSEIDRVTRLVKNHMFYYPYKDEKAAEKEITEKGSTEFKYWSDSAVRRFVRRVGVDLIDDLFALRIADATSNPKTIFDPGEVTALQERISEVRKKDMVLKITDLEISGDDLKKIGIPSAKIMGDILKELLEIVTDDPLKNDKELLMDEAMRLFKSKDRF